MSDLEILKAARAKIEKGWSQGAMARDASHNSVPETSPAAAKWCAVGAIHSIALTEDCKCMLVENLCGLGSLSSFNDAEGRTQAEVLVVFDHAIAVLEATP